MKPDLLDELRAADPERDPAAAPDPAWEAMAARILATPRRRRRRRLALVVAPATAAAALAAVVATALVPGSAPPSVLDRAYAALSQSAIYHYVVTSRELEGPERRPVADTRSTREGWVDPATGRIHEIYRHGDEWATDGRRRTMYTAFNDTIQRFDEPPGSGGSGSAAGNVAEALTRSYRAGALRDEGTESFEGRRVRRLVAENPDRTWRQTFLLDAETLLPVLFLSETGDHLRDGGDLPPGQRLVEERYERFERLPADTDPSVLSMREHPGAKRGPEPPVPATP